MASTSSSTRAEPRFDDLRTVPNAAPTVPQDPFGGVEETLAKLAHRAAGDTRDPRPRGPASGTSADARVAPSSAAATPGPATLGPAELSTQIPRESRSLGKLRTFANVAMVTCIGAAVIFAWRSYGGPARHMLTALASQAGQTSARAAADEPPIPPMPDPSPTLASAQAAAPAAAEQPAPPPAQPAPAQLASIAPAAPAPAAEPPVPPAPSADHQQIDAMARDVAALRQTVEQLASGQAQLKDEIAKLQAEKAAAAKPPPEKPKKRVVHHVPSADHPADAFNPAQNPGAPGAPRSIGTVVERHAAPPPYPPPVTSSALVPPPPPELSRRPPAPVPMAAPLPAPMPAQ